MLRIVAISDSHANTQAMEAAVPYIKAMKPDIIVHLGDYVRDVAFLEKRLSHEILRIQGNGDFGQASKHEEIIEAQGRKILFAHGHLHLVKSGSAKILSYARQMGFDAAVFGHTHRQIKEERDGIFLLNPGALTNYCDGGKKGILVIELEDGKLEAVLL